MCLSSFVGFFVLGAAALLTWSVSFLTNSLPFNPILTLDEPADDDCIDGATMVPSLVIILGRGVGGSGDRGVV